MTKRTKNLYHYLLEPDVIYRAFVKSRCGKNHKREVIEFANNLPLEIESIVSDLSADSYQVGEYTCFTVYEPKERLIKAPKFRDVVVQRALHDLICPVFERCFIHDSYGCRVGKGTHAAARAVQLMQRNSPKGSHYAQFDIRKYFFRVLRTCTVELLEKRIADRRLVKLLAQFLPDEVGMPIGNLLSQLYANIYLDPIDHFVKRELGFKRYARYMDDFVIVGENIERLREVEPLIVNELNKYGLELSRSTFGAVEGGIGFVGHRITDERVAMNKNTVKKFYAAINMKTESQTVISLLGHARHTKQYPTFRDLIKERAY